jgi:hypothetical protein
MKKDRVKRAEQKAQINNKSKPLLVLWDREPTPEERQTREIIKVVWGPGKS